MNKNICSVKGCINEGRYCRIHPVGSLNKQKPIAPRSKKLAAIMRKEYVPQVKEMIADKAECKIKSPVCIKKAQGFHHLQGREGKNLTGKKKIPACNPCNLFIEKNDAWARANGFKLSKHSNYKREK